MARFHCNKCQKESYEDNWDSTHVCDFFVEELRLAQAVIYFDPLPLDVTGSLVQPALSPTAVQADIRNPDLNDTLTLAPAQEFDVD